MKDDLHAMNKRSEKASAPTVDSISRYVDRDLSWLEFNRRVLHEALDSRTPLLERLQFLKIFTTNLDEFFMKRIGAVMHRQSEKDAQLHGDREPLVQRLKAIHDMVAPMVSDRTNCLRDQILPQLDENNIQLLDWNDLTDRERGHANTHFQNNVFPILTPQSVDHSHPFPFMSNLSVSLAIRLKNPFTDERLFARVKVPKLLPQWIELEPEPTGVRRFIDLRTIIFHNLSFLFPGMTIQNVMTLRVTRSAEIDYDDEDSDDLLELVTEEVRQRRLQRVVRLEHSPTDDRWLLDTVVNNWSCRRNKSMRCRIVTIMSTSIKLPLLISRICTTLRGAPPFLCRWSLMTLIFSPSFDPVMYWSTTLMKVLMHRYPGSCVLLSKTKTFWRLRWPFIAPAKIVLFSLF